MKSRFLLFALSTAVIFSSCSAVYKTGQTPDDVYYSPAPPRAETYVETRQEKEGSNYQSYQQYQDSYRDMNFLRLSLGNPYYMNAYNSYSAFDWRYNSFYDGYNYGFTSPWNNYFAWNNFYNPYCYNPIMYYGYGGYGGYYGGTGSIKYTNYTQPISRPLAFNVSSYSSNPRSSARPYSNNNTYYNSGNNQRTSSYGQRYNNSNNGSNYNYNNNSSNGNHNTNTYTPSTNTYTPSRSYTPSSGGGGGSSSGGGGGGGVSRPSRGN